MGDVIDESPGRGRRVVIALITVGVVLVVGWLLGINWRGVLVQLLG